MGLVANGPYGFSIEEEAGKRGRVWAVGGGGGGVEGGGGAPVPNSPSGLCGRQAGTVKKRGGRGGQGGGAGGGGWEGVAIEFLTSRQCGF